MIKLWDGGLEKKDKRGANRWQKEDYRLKPDIEQSLLNCTSKLLHAVWPCIDLLSGQRIKLVPQAGKSGRSTGS